MEHYDLIVIGSGPAGRRAAIQAAKLGKQVLVVENRLRVGGVSVHTGTIPSKTLRETVLNLSGWRERGFYGLAYRVKKDIEGKDLGARLRMTLDHEINVLEHQFARNGVKTLAGRARFLDPHTLAVTNAEEENSITGDKIVVAVGTSPYRPANIPFNDTSVFDSDNVASDPRVPRSLTVVGAGVIGLEYATIFSALDVPVTLVEPREHFLEFIDREIIEEFVHELRKRGMQLRLGVKVEAVELDEAGWTISTLSDGRKIRTEMLLYAAGRIGATADLGLETCGIEPDSRGRLKVDPISDLESRKLLGAHIIGEGATELVHIGQAVLNLGGTVDYFVENASTILPSPRPTRSPPSTPTTACRAEASLYLPTSFLLASSLSESELRHTGVFWFCPELNALVRSVAADWHASLLWNAASAVKSGRLAPVETT